MIALQKLNTILNVRTSVTCSYYHHFHWAGLVNRKLSECEIVHGAWLFLDVGLKWVQQAVLYYLVSLRHRYCGHSYLCNFETHVFCLPKVESRIPRTLATRVSKDRGANLDCFFKRHVKRTNYTYPDRTYPDLSIERGF